MHSIRNGDYALDLESRPFLIRDGDKSYIVFAQGDMPAQTCLNYALGESGRWLGSSARCWEITSLRRAEDGTILDGLKPSEITTVTVRETKTPQPCALD